MTVSSVKTVQIGTLVNIVHYFHHQNFYTQQPGKSDPTSVQSATQNKKTIYSRSEHTHHDTLAE